MFVYNKLIYFIFPLERGLKSIESEANHSNGGQRVLADSTSSRSAIDNNSTNSAASDGMAPHLLYLDRLKKLRAQAGLERGGSAASSTTSYSSGIASSAASGGGSVYKISATSESYSSRGYATLTSSEPETDSTSSTLTAGSQLSQSNNHPADNPPDVDAIRKRLERIKQSAF